MKAELEASDVEADVERLVEIRCDPQQGAVPRLGPLEVGNLIDGASQSEKRGGLHDRISFPSYWVSEGVRSTKPCLSWASRPFKCSARPEISTP